MVVHLSLGARTPASPPPEDPPCQGLGSRRTASAFERAPRRECGRARDALPRSLQPTSCHEHPRNSQLPGTTLARRPTRGPPDSPVTRALTRAGEVEARHGRRRTVAGPNDPGWCGVWTTPSPTAAQCILPVGSTFFEAEDPRSTCSAEPEPVALAADASCRTHGTPGTRPCSPLSTEDPSSRDAPTSRGPGSEAPSIDRSTVRPRALARQRPASVTTRKASPPSCGFRPAFTHTLCALGATAQSYSLPDVGPRGVRRLLQSGESVSTPHEPPKPQHSRGESTPPVGRQHPEGHHRPSFQQVRGRAPFGRAFGTHRGDRSPWVDLPQPDRPEHPCRSSVSRSAWKIPSATPMR